MRSRTEMVTTTLDGSDFDEETDFEDSEEDWRPEKGEAKAMKRKSRDILTGRVSAGRGRGGRSNGSKRGRKPATRGRGSFARKRYSDDGDDDEDDDDDDDDDEEDSRFDSEASGSSTPPVPKRGRIVTQRVYGRKSNSSKMTPTTSKRGRGGMMGRVKQSPTTSPGSGSELAVKPIQRKVASTPGSLPDKSGILKLFACHADLEEGIRDNLKVCLWRRDGSSLLQKYFRDKSVDPSTPQFTSSMVYSYWEDKRADEYMEVRVRCIEQTKQLRVQIIDVDATERRAKEEYQKYFAKYGKSSESNRNGNRSGSGSGSDGADGSKKTHRKQRATTEQQQEEEEYDEAEEPEHELEENRGEDEESEIPSQEE